jgi:hypothetical protein
VLGLAREEDPGLRDVALLAIGVAGAAMCLMLMFLAMRSVMDIGGSCAEGGPYVIDQPCPEGATPALLLGIFGLFGFGALAMAAGARVGGYAGLPLLAWTALFASLGWNFLDYGILNPPPDAGIVWGWLIPGVMFEVMAWGPLLFVAAAWREARRSGRPFTPSQTGMTGVLRRPALRPASRPSAPPQDPAPATDRPGDAAAEEFSEGTQALLDRLERLADLRDRGLLGAEEYETAKEAVMRELEARS